MAQRTRWPQTIVRAARRLRTEEGITAAQIARRLESEHGVKVSASTVGGWLGPQRVDRAAPEDVPAAIASQAARLLALTASEIGRLERQTGERDLERLERLARVLKTTEALRPAPSQRVRGVQARSLLDLGGNKGGEEGEAGGTGETGASDAEDSDAF